MLEYSELKGTHQDHQVPAQDTPRIMYLKALSKHLNSVKLGVTATSLSSLFQCSINLWVKNLFLISSLKLP